MIEDIAVKIKNPNPKEEQKPISGAMLLKSDDDPKQSINILNACR